MASSSRDVVGHNGDDSLLSAPVEIYFEIVKKKIKSVYADFTPIPPRTALEIEFPNHQLC